MRPTGPNVKKLITRKMALDAIPSGGGLASAIDFLKSTDKMLASVRDATAWVFLAIDTVKTARDSPFGEDDEAIAAEILKRVVDRSKRP